MSGGIGGSSMVALQDRLARLQLAQIAHRHRALIVFEGWEGSGRRAALRRLSAAWDPCHFTAHCAPEVDKSGRHWLARYWSALPEAGSTALFHQSWYGPLVADRAHGRLTDKAWARRCDEINEFEAQQRDHGTLVVKLFMDISPATQAERIAAIEADPWRRALRTPIVRAQPPREALQAAWSELFAQTDTRWAPWHLIDANDREAGEAAALGAIAEALQKSVPLDPPADPAELQRVG